MARGSSARNKEVLDETARILGIRQRLSTPLELTPIIRKGLPARSFTEVAKRLDMSVQHTAESLGLATRTIARRLAHDQPLGAEESERVVRLARVLALATDVLGSIDKVRRWLSKPNRALGGAVPLSLLDTDVGGSAVLEELGRIEHGVFV